MAERCASSGMPPGGAARRVPGAGLGGMTVSRVYLDCGLRGALSAVDLQGDQLGIVGTVTVGTIAQRQARVIAARVFGPIQTRGTRSGGQAVHWAPSCGRLRDRGGPRSCGFRGSWEGQLETAARLRCSRWLRGSSVVGALCPGPGLAMPPTGERLSRRMAGRRRLVFSVSSRCAC